MSGEEYLKTEQAAAEHDAQALESNTEIANVNHKMKAESLEDFPQILGNDDLIEGNTEKADELLPAESEESFIPAARKKGSKKAAKPELKEEEKFVFIYTENIKILDSVKKQAAKDGITVVLLTEEDFEAMSRAEEKRVKGESTSETISDFVKDKDNFKAAEEHATKLLGLITPKGTINPMDVIHTETEVVKKTTLSHRQAREVINLLNIFGFVQYTKGTHEFKFTNNPQAVIDMVVNEVNESCEALKYNMARFEAITENTLEDKDKAHSIYVDVVRNIKKNYGLEL